MRVEGRKLIRSSAYVRAGPELPGHQVTASDRVCWNVESFLDSTWAKQARSTQFFWNHRSQILIDGSVLFGIHAHRNLEDKHGHPLSPGPPLRSPFLCHRPEPCPTKLVKNLRPTLLCLDGHLTLLLQFRMRSLPGTCWSPTV